MNEQSKKRIDQDPYTDDHNVACIPRNVISNGSLLPIDFLAEKETPERERETSPSTEPGGVFLSSDFEPLPYSVVLGRGKGSYNYIGNRRFRVLADSFVKQYSEASRASQKSVIIDKLLGMVKEACPVGAFCKYDEEKERWYECDEKTARQKVSTTLRDCMRAQEKTKTVRMGNEKRDTKRACHSDSSIRSADSQDSNFPSYYDVDSASRHSL